MRDMIGYCGLDCEKCDAYIATVNDDQALREKTAKLWAELNNAPIPVSYTHLDVYKRQVYEEIKSQADKVVYTSHDYFRGCMFKRNRHLVNGSSVCIAYLTQGDARRL